MTLAANVFRVPLVVLFVKAPGGVPVELKAGPGRRYALQMTHRQMTHRRSFLVVALAGLLGVAVACRTTPEAPSPRAAIDRDLLDVTVPQLHRLYAEKTYTVTKVVQWHLDRIDRYNGVYGAIETVFRREALAQAAREDAEAAKGGGTRGPLWGVPNVIQAKPSVKGQVTTAGWEGFRRAGHELIAPQDATVV